MALPRRIGLALLIMSFMAPAAWAEAAETRTEYQIKSAFLINFARFVEWPDTGEARRAPFTMCVVGRDPCGELLDQAAEHNTVNGRPVVVIRATRLSEIHSCHAVFFPASETHRFEEMRQVLRERSILTIGEAKGFAARGGIINFVSQDGRIRFEINPAAAAQSHLAIAAKLLQLAIIVPAAPPLK